MNETPLIIYHKNCLDGFTAAWATALGTGWPNKKCELHPAGYGDEPPDVADRVVFIVDFSYPRDVLDRMHEDAQHLLVLDHHKTAAEALKGAPYAIFDMERSGAALAWDYFFPSEKRPWIVDVVQDRDLWRWELPDTKDITTYLGTVDHTLDLWSFVRNDGPAQAVAKGQAMNVYRDMLITNAVEHAGQGSLAGVDEHEVPIVNTIYAIVSEVGNALALHAPFAVMWAQDDKGRFVYSLRSSADYEHHMDVSDIAKTFGGGGHKHAAGFKTDKMVHRLVVG